MHRSIRKSRAVLAAALAMAISTFALATPASAWDDTHTLMQGSPTPMGQTNGPVWTTQIAGNKIFVGGAFTSTRPQGVAAGGASETGQAYLAAFDATTGAPVTSFNPVLKNTWNGSPAIVRTMALSPDKSTLYVGGDFNEINGQRAEHVAAFDTATGAFKGEVGWYGVDGFVQGMAVSNNGQTLYVGGAFSRANFSTRNNLAAFNLTDGSLRPWAPTVGSPVSGEALRVVALAVSSDDSQVFVAGPFRTVNGKPAQGFMGTSASAGANISKYSSAYLYAPYGWGTSLAVKDDTVYLGSRDDKTTTLDRTEGVNSINTTTGARRWYANCYGDTFAVLPIGDDVYVGSHSHDCAPNGGMIEYSPRTYLSIHALSRTTGEERPYFSVTNGVSSNPDSLLLSRALATDGNQLVMGGGFNTANGTAQANVARFMTGSAAPDRAAWPSGSSCASCAYTNLTVLKGADRDDIKLTYEIYRDWSTTDPIKTLTSDSFPYLNSTFTFRDTGVVLGQQVYYRVLVKDPAGNAVWSVRTPTMTVGSSGTTDAAPTTMSADSATTTKAAPTTVAKTKAQRAAELAAAIFGLQPNGKRSKGTPAPKQPAPVMDDPSVPTRQPTRP